MTKEEIKNIVRHVFHFYEANVENCNWTDMNEACGEILKALEQQPKWIPVSERLPDAQKDGDNDFSDWVQITIKLGENNDVVSEAYYCFSENKWYTDRFVLGEVIAWMHLPEPYKVESEDKECR